MTHEVVERFGKLLMEQRDVAIRQHEWAVRGSGRTKGFADRNTALSQLSDDERAVARREVIEAVDTAIHQILYTFEQHDLIGFDVMFVGTDDDPIAQPVSVSDLSDGLGGELYTEDGWISKYSAYEDFSPRLVDGVWYEPGEAP